MSRAYLFRRRPYICARKIALTVNYEITAPLLRFDVALVAQKFVRMLNGYNAYARLLGKYTLRRKTRAERIRAANYIVAHLRI